jgi:hypothetical protein
LITLIWLRGFFGLASIGILGLCLGLSAQTQHKNAPPAAPSTGTGNQDAQLYRNSVFGFRYQIPYGWVDRTREMNVRDSTGDAGSESSSSSKGASKEHVGGRAEVLLGVFERPPEATGDSINSGVVIASESAASYPGLNKAEDYLSPLTEVATAKGFKSADEPYALEVESQRLVRADFIKPLSDKLTMRQCTLILLTKGRIVSFTFIADSEDGLDDIMDGLHFFASGGH